MTVCGGKENITTDKIFFFEFILFKFTHYIFDSYSGYPGKSDVFYLIFSLHVTIIILVFETAGF